MITIMYGCWVNGNKETCMKFEVYILANHKLDSEIHASFKLEIGTDFENFLEKIVDFYVINHQRNSVILSVINTVLKKKVD